MARSRFISAAALMAFFCIGTPQFAMSQVPFGTDYLISDMTAAFGMVPTPLTADEMYSLQMKKRPLRFRPKLPRVQIIVLSVDDLVEAKQYQEALAKLKELDQISGRTAEDIYLAERTRAAIAAKLGDDEQLSKSLAVLVDSNLLPVEDRLIFLNSLASMSYKRSDYPKAIQWMSRYLKEDGKNQEIRWWMAAAYYLNKEYISSANEIRTAISADEEAGKTPSRDKMRLLLSAEVQSGDKARYMKAIEKMVAYYPRKEDWTELLNYFTSRPEFREDLVLDVYRLMFKLGQFNKASDYTDLAQLTIQSGYPAEAREVLSQGYKNGILGKGAAATAHKQMAKLASMRAADQPKSLVKEQEKMIKSNNGDGLLHIGYIYVTGGQFDKGLSLMEQGMQLGGIENLDLAKLHLGIAKAAAGRKNEAIQTLKSVQGTDGAAELARYWAIQLAQPNT